MKRSEKKRIRLKKLGRLKSEWARCRKCPLFKGRKNIVWWRGHPLAKLFIIGEAPGKDEDKSGIPFVGISGKLLDEMIDNLELDINSKKDIFIANTVGCYPPIRAKGGRAPEPNDVFKCRSRLDRMLDIVNPKCVLLLGMTAARSMIGATTMKSVAGKINKVELWNDRAVPVITTYHPSYILRQGKNKELVELVKGHIKKAWRLANKDGKTAKSER